MSETQTNEVSTGEIPKRPLGKTGEAISIIGVGGAHIGMDGVTTKEAINIVHRSIDHGITFLDNAWEYNDGRSESLMGQAIYDRRDKVFLMTKVCARDRYDAEQHLHDSLRRLRTDYIDLWQFHEVNYANDPEWIFAPGGAAEAALAALKSGKVRFVGCTGHKEPGYLLKMLEHDFPWTSVQMPVSVLDASYRSFIKSVLPVCKERGIAALGMKSLGSGRFILQGGISKENCLRFALSQTITSLICGMKNSEEVDENIRIARDFKPMSRDEQNALIDSTKSAAGDGRLELYKSTQLYDSRYHRQQHNFPEI
jgi:aryl-alcohol dehydrogenase-like predicted oxidoreductase